MKLELKDDDNRLIYSWDWRPFDDPPTNWFELTSNLMGCLMDFGQIKDMEPTEVYNELMEEGKNDTNS